MAISCSVGRDYVTIEPIVRDKADMLAKILAWEPVAMAALGGLTVALAKGDSRILDGGTF